MDKFIVFSMILIICGVLVVFAITLPAMAELSHNIATIIRGSM